MKSKLVLWGSNAQDEKCLIAVSLRTADNKVDIWTFPESVATEDFYQRMMKEWRDGSGMELTDATTQIERDLSLSESILPDDLKVERGDVVQRAQSEWQFAVLSSKLNESYENQLAELKERVGKLESFDQPTWDKLRELWDKVQEQVRERNLFRDHADRLRNNLNELFGEMKTMRSKLDDEFQSLSKEAHDKFFAALDEVQRKMESGARVPVLFDELRKLQSMFRESKTLSREHRNKVWDKLDGTFKAVKQKRFGGKPGGDPNAKGGGSMLQGTQHRLDGLLTAIDKMEQSIRRDRNDLEFQMHKINTTDGQLEAQIRQAKLKMIEERVHSKEEKLNEMTTTKVELEKRIGSLKEKEARRAAQEAAKEKIVGEIKAAAEAREDVAEKLDKAAEEITTAKGKKAPKAAKAVVEPIAAEEPAAEESFATEAPAAEEAPQAEAPKTESILGAVSTIMGESFDDIVDTVKAVASVLGDKIEEAIEELKEDFHEATAPEAPAAETTAAAEETEPTATEEAPAAEEAEPVVAEATAVAEEAPVAEEVASEKTEEA
jgi:conjugal transfer/entry exclusion protein